MIFGKIALSVFITLWSCFGIWLLLRYQVLFGPHPDDPAESPGARSFGVAHICAVWFGIFLLAGYFLIR